MMTTRSTGARSSGPGGRSGGRSDERPGGPPGGPRRFGGRRKVCAFCADKQAVIDYKAVGRLRRYFSEQAKVESGRKTGTCARHQRLLREAIKRARLLALLPLASKHRRVTGPVAPPRTEERVEERPDSSAVQADVAGQPEPETAVAEEAVTEADPAPETAEEEAAETKAEADPAPETAEEETGETKAQADPAPEAAEEETGETKAQAGPAPEAEVGGEGTEEEEPET